MGNSESLRKRRRADNIVSMGRVWDQDPHFWHLLLPQAICKVPCSWNCINLSRWAGIFKMDDSFCAFSSPLKNPFAMCLLLEVQNASAPGRPCVFHPLSVITSKWLHRPGNGPPKCWNGRKRTPNWPHKCLLSPSERLAWEDMTAESG